MKGKNEYALLNALFGVIEKEIYYIRDVIQKVITIEEILNNGKRRGNI